MDEAKRRIAWVFTLFLLALTGSLHAADKPAICFAPGTPPEYAASITRQFSRAGHSLGLVQSFRTGARWTSTATDGGGLRQGEPITLTWSYVPDGTQIGGSAGEPAAPSNLHAWLDGLYGSQAVWHALFERVFRRWEALTGIHYVYEPNDDGAPLGLAGGVLGVRGDVRIGAHPIDGDFGILAYNFYPPGGDMVIDSGDRFFNDTSNDSLKFRNVLAHEHGHGLGLAHVCPIDRTKLMEPYLSTRFDGPQFDDRAGAQSLYGDPREDNDRLTAASLLGTLGAGDSLSVDALSIDGATDTDLFALTLPAGARLSVQVDPGVHLPYREGPQNANGSCSTSNLFDPRVRRDLGLELLDAAGRNIALADAAGVGQPEALSGVTVSAPGTYYLRVYSDDAGSALQAYALSVDVSGGAPPPASADLGLTLADSADPVVTGQTYDYTATVTNHGPDAASAVTLTYTVPAGLSVRSATATQGSCRTAGATVTCDLGGVAAGSTVVSTLRVRADVAGSQALTAAVAAAEPDPVTANDAATETTAVSDPAPAAQADLAVALTHSPEPVPLDATAVLRVEVSNGGPDTATDVRVLDRLPPGLAYLSARVVPVSGADLGVEVRDTADPVGVGETLEYVVTVRNAGPGEASGVVVRDTLPAGLSYVSASAGQGSCTQSGAVVRCELGVLGSGTQTTVRIRVRAEAAGTHHNRVTVQGNEPDPVAVNDTAGESTTVTGGGGGVPGDLALSVQDSVAPALRGQRFEQTVRVVNQGPDTVDRVLVYLRYFGSVVRVQPPAGCRGSRGTYRCALGSLSGGDAVDLVFGVTPLRAGTLRLRAMVYGTPTDPDFSDNRLLHTTSVQ